MRGLSGSGPDDAAVDGRQLVGGKVGINHPAAKNLIGAFHQPRAVVIDPSFLATLAPRQLRSGAYEILKCAILGDDALFADLRRARRSARLGARRARERDRHGLPDQGRRRRAGRARGRPAARAHLGHTIGHALEAVTDYRRFTHGEAVGWVSSGRLDRAAPRDARRDGVARARLRGRPRRSASPRLGPRSGTDPGRAGTRQEGPGRAGALRAPHRDRGRGDPGRRRARRGHARAAGDGGTRATAG